MPEASPRRRPSPRHARDAITRTDAEAIVRGAIAGLTEPLAQIVDMLRRQFESEIEALRKELRGELRAAEDNRLRATVDRLAELTARIERLSVDPRRLELDAIEVTDALH